MASNILDLSTGLYSAGSVSKAVLFANHSRDSIEITGDVVPSGKRFLGSLNVSHRAGETPTGFRMRISIFSTIRGYLNNRLADLSSDWELTGITTVIVGGTKYTFKQAEQSPIDTSSSYQWNRPQDKLSDLYSALTDSSVMVQFGFPSDGFKLGFGGKTYNKVQFGGKTYNKMVFNGKTY